MKDEFTPLELLANEISRLEERRKSMEAAIKASEARLKDIRSGYDLAAIKVKQDLDHLQIEQERKMAELNAMSEPLHGQIEALRYQVAKEEARLTEMEEQGRSAVNARRIELDTIEAAILDKHHRLVELTNAVNALKEKVEAL